MPRQTEGESSISPPRAESSNEPEWTGQQRDSGARLEKSSRPTRYMYILFLYMCTHSFLSPSLHLLCPYSAHKISLNPAVYRSFLPSFLHLEARRSIMACLLLPNKKKNKPGLREQHISKDLCRAFHSLFAKCLYTAGFYLLLFRQPRGFVASPSNLKKHFQVANLFFFFFFFFQM